MEKILGYIDVYDATPDDKKKSKIAEIADELGVPPWEVAEQLKAAGCKVDLHWFNQQKIKAARAASGGQTSAAEAAAEKEAQAAQKSEGTSANRAYLQKIIKEQDKRMRALKAERDELEHRGRQLTGEIYDKDRELAELEAALRLAEEEKKTLEKKLEDMQGRYDYANAELTEADRELDGYRAAEDDRLALRNENELLNAKIELLLNGASMLKEMAAAVEEPEEPAPHFEMEPLREYPALRVPGGELDLCDVLNDFCRNLGGVESYLCGRIIEALWCWRLKGSDALRVLQGLVSELIEMQLEEKEASECSG